MVRPERSYKEGYHPNSQVGRVRHFWHNNHFNGLREADFLGLCAYTDAMEDPFIAGVYDLVFERFKLRQWGLLGYRFGRMPEDTLFLQVAVTPEETVEIVNLLVKTRGGANPDLLNILMWADPARLDYKKINDSDLREAYYRCACLCAVASKKVLEENNLSDEEIKKIGYRFVGQHRRYSAQLFEIGSIRKARGLLLGGGRWKPKKNPQE